MRRRLSSSATIHRLPASCCQLMSCVQIWRVYRVDRGVTGDSWVVDIATPVYTRGRDRCCARRSPDGRPSWTMCESVYVERNCTGLAGVKHDRGSRTWTRAGPRDVCDKIKPREHKSKEVDVQFSDAAEYVVILAFNINCKAWPLPVFRAGPAGVPRLRSAPSGDLRCTIVANPPSRCAMNRYT